MADPSHLVRTGLDLGVAVALMGSGTKPETTSKNSRVARNRPDAKNNPDAKNRPDAKNSPDAKNNPDAKNRPDAKNSPDAKGRSLLGRRDFLSRSSLGLLAGSLLTGAALTLRALWPRASRASLTQVVAGRPQDFAVGQVHEGLLKQHRVWLVRTQEGFFAFSSRCTHLGCQLRHVPSAREYRCMCHGSIFDADGQVLRGPAPRPMERVRLVLDKQGRLWVDPSVLYRQERGEWSQPGAFVPYGESEERS